MDLLYPYVSHHLLLEGRLTLGADKDQAMCCVACPGGQDIARFGQRKDSLTCLLHGAEAKLRQWYEAKGQDSSKLRRLPCVEQAAPYKLRFAVDFIRDQGKVEFGDQRGLCCTLRTINGHTVWHGGNRHMGLSGLLWEVEKQLTQHYNRVGWQCRSLEEDMLSSGSKRKASPPSPSMLLVSSPSPKPPLVQLSPPSNAQKAPSTSHQKTPPTEDKETQDLFKQLQHLQQMQHIQQQQYMQQQQHMYQMFFEQMHRQQQQQQQLFQHVLQMLILQQNLQPSEGKAAADQTSEAEGSPSVPPSLESTPATSNPNSTRKKAKK